MKKSQMGSSKYEFDGDLDADVKRRQEVIDQLYSEITEYLFDKSLEYQVMMNGNGSYNVFLHEVMKMKCKLVLANKLICVKDLVNENGAVLSKKGVKV